MKDLTGMSYEPKGDKEFQIAIRMLSDLGYPFHRLRDCKANGLDDGMYLVWDGYGTPYNLVRASNKGTINITSLEGLVTFLFTEEQSPAQKEHAILLEKIAELQQQANKLGDSL